MNHGVKTYRSPTRMQLRDARHQRGQLKERFSGALDDLNMISMAAKENVAHVDPLEHIEGLKGKTHELFTPIPENFKPKGGKNKKNKDYANMESRLKPTLEGNKEWADSLKDRPQHQPPSHEAITGSKKPLKLSYDAELVLNGKKQNTANSTLSGLFSQNAAITDGAEQGPVPPLYNPDPEDNPKARVAKKREEHLSKFIVVDKTRKAKILQVKPLPPTKKVDPDFVPGCGAHIQAPETSRRAEVEEKNAHLRSARVNAKPFR